MALWLALWACADPEGRPRAEVDVAAPGIALVDGFFVEEGPTTWTAFLTGGPGCRACADTTAAVDAAWAALDAGELSVEAGCGRLAAAWVSRWAEAPWVLRVHVTAEDEAALLAGDHEVDVDLLDEDLPWDALCRAPTPGALRHDLASALAPRTHAAVGELRIDAWAEGRRIVGSLDLAVDGVGDLVGTWDVPACGGPVAVDPLR